MDITDRQAKARDLWLQGKAPNEIAHMIGENTTAAQVKSWLRAMDIPERPTRPGEAQDAPEATPGAPNYAKYRP